MSKQKRNRWLPRLSASIHIMLSDKEKKHGRGAQGARVLNPGQEYGILCHGLTSGHHHGGPILCYSAYMAASENSNGKYKASLLAQRKLSAQLRHKKIPALPLLHLTPVTTLDWEAKVTRRADKHSSNRCLQKGTFLNLRPQRYHTCLCLIGMPAM